MGSHGQPSRWRKCVRADRSDPRRGVPWRGWWRTSTQFTTRVIGGPLVVDTFFGYSACHHCRHTDQQLAVAHQRCWVRRQLVWLRACLQPLSTPSWTGSSWSCNTCPARDMRKRQSWPRIMHHGVKHQTPTVRSRETDASLAPRPATELDSAAACRLNPDMHAC